MAAEGTFFLRKYNSKYSTDEKLTVALCFKS